MEVKDLISPPSTERLTDLILTVYDVYDATSMSKEASNERSASEVWTAANLVLHINGGTTRKSGRCPVLIGRTISRARGADGAILLIRIAESRG